MVVHIVARILCNISNHPCMLYVDFALSISLLVDEHIEKQHFPYVSSSTSVRMASTVLSDILPCCKDERRELFVTEKTNKSQHK